MSIRFFSIIFLFVTNIFANDVLEIYFDTPKLYLLKNDISLKYEAVKYLSKKKNKVKYNESIIFTTKDKKLHTFKVKHYNSVKYFEEKHPLLSLVKRKDRQLFIQLLKNNGIKYPMKLKYVFERTYSSDDSSKKEHQYKKLVTEKINDDKFFKIKFKYPYFVNLFYALSIGFIGIAIIMVFYRKRLFK